MGTRVPRGLWVEIPNILPIKKNWAGRQPNELLKIGGSCPVLQSFGQVIGQDLRSAG